MGDISIIHGSAGPGGDSANGMELETEMTDRRNMPPRRKNDADIEQLAERIIDGIEERLQRRAGVSALNALWTLVLVAAGIIVAWARGWFK